MTDDTDSPVSVAGETLIVEVPVVDEVRLAGLEQRLETGLDALTALLAETRRMLLVIRRARVKFSQPPPAEPPILRAVGPQERPRKKP